MSESISLPNSRLSAPERAHVLALGQQGLGPRSIARQLQRKPTEIIGTYRAYVQAGLIAHRPSTRGPDWTPDELAQLETLIDAGYGYDVIAARLKRTRWAVILKCQRLDHRIQTTDATHSCRDVAALLGLGCAKIVTAWIDRGWLLARNAGTVEKPLWRILLEDVQALLAAPQTWMAWHPSLITDPDLRTWAAALREGQPCWLSVGDVAQRYHVARSTTSGWIYKGWLPSVRYGNHWMWESDLDDWQPPAVRVGRTWPSVVDPTWRTAMQWGPGFGDLGRFARTVAILSGMGLSWQEVADVFDTTPNVLSVRLRHARKRAGLVEPTRPAGLPCVRGCGRDAWDNRGLCGACRQLMHYHGRLAEFPRLYGWLAAPLAPLVRGAASEDTPPVPAPAPAPTIHRRGPRFPAHRLWHKAEQWAQIAAERRAHHPDWTIAAQLQLRWELAQLTALLWGMGVPQKEIAALVAMSPSNVSQLWRRAREQGKPVVPEKVYGPGLCACGCGRAGNHNFGLFESCYLRLWRAGHLDPYREGKRT